MNLQTVRPIFSKPFKLCGEKCAYIHGSFYYFCSKQRTNTHPFNILQISRLPLQKSIVAGDETAIKQHSQYYSHNDVTLLPPQK